MDQINNTFKQCLAKSENRKCINIFIPIICVQVLTFSTGLSLNAIIIRSVYYKSSLRKKNHNILLFNQSIADLVNMLVYVFPNIIHLFYQIVTHKMITNFAKMNIVFVYFTVASSMCLFFVISFERFLSLFVPFWHRVHVRKRHVWIAVAFGWATALLLSFILLFIMFYHVDDGNRWEESMNYMYMKYHVAMNAIDISTIALIAVIFLLSFIKAFTSIRSQSQEELSIQVKARKQFRLTLIFSTMFIFFIVALVPGVSAAATDICFTQSHFKACTQVFISTFTLTSIYNPALTLCFKKEFRWRSSSAYRSNNNQAIHTQSELAQIRSNRDSTKSLVSLQMGRCSHT